MRCHKLGTAGEHATPSGQGHQPEERWLHSFQRNAPDHQLMSCECQPPSHEKSLDSAQWLHRLGFVNPVLGFDESFGSLRSVAHTVGPDRCANFTIA